MMARSTLNSIERKISKALIYNELSREDFTNEENIYRELKESKCKKKKNINTKVSKTNNGKIMLLSKCTICYMW